MTAILYSSKRIISTFSSYPHIVLRSIGSSSEAFRSLQREHDLSASSSCGESNNFDLSFYRIKLPHLIQLDKNQRESDDIKLVDHNLWPVSFDLCHSMNQIDAAREISSNLDEDSYDNVGDSMAEISLDFDEIEDLKFRKKLFYKLDRSSKEYEECNLYFLRRKSSKKQMENQRKMKMANGCKKSEATYSKPPPKDSMTVKSMNSSSKALNSKIYKEFSFVEGKKMRTPTFNQLTDPFHLPFCLDIFVTKGSVRASVIHRITSKVVAVAHSISKDMKFDLTFKKDATACAAVGEILARRAIEDDIHNVVYTPRKGDKIEGKLRIVLQSIIDHGVDVKVKLKQKKPAKGSTPNIRVHHS